MLFTHNLKLRNLCCCCFPHLQEREERDHQWRAPKGWWWRGHTHTQRFFAFFFFFLSEKRIPTTAPPPPPSACGGLILWAAVQAGVRRREEKRVFPFLSFSSFCFSMPCAFWQCSSYCWCWPSCSQEQMPFLRSTVTVQIWVAVCATEMPALHSALVYALHICLFCSASVASLHSLAKNAFLLLLNTN